MKDTPLLAHQSRLTRLDGRQRLAAITAWLLFGVGLLNGWLYYAHQHDTRAEAQRATYAQWLNQPQKNPHSAAHYGFYAYKPLSVMAVGDKGMEDYLGSAVWLEAHNQNEVKVRAIQDATFLARFGDLTVGFVWQYLFPLLIILLTFNTLTSEREQGTLKMLLVAGASKYEIIQAKFLAAYRTVLWLFVPTFLLLNVVMLALDPADYAAHLPHLLVLLLLLGLYFAFFTLAGVLVSALTRDSGNALFRLLAVWVLICTVLPRISASVGRQVQPLPTAFSFWKDMKDEMAVGRAERADSLDRVYLAKYQVDSVKNLPINYVGVQLQASEEHGDLIHDRFYGELERREKRQNRLIGLGAVLSPVTALRNVSRALAGTDSDTQEHFIHQAETHRRLIQKTMNGAIVEASKDAKGAIPMLETSLWETVPQFEFQRAGIGRVLAQQWLSVLVLLAWAGLLALSVKNVSKRMVV